MAATGTAAVADDTGLEVDALGGAPGVYSARYAGEDATYADNVAKLLRELAALEDAGGERRARFKTVALAAFPDGSEVWAEGVLAGTIAAERRGDNGFGYDPVFVPDGGDGPDVRRDAAGREGRGVPPRPGLPGAGRRAGPAAGGAVAGQIVRRRATGAPQSPRSAPASSRYSASGNSWRSATTWMQTWSAPASWWARTADATASVSPQGMTASIRRSLPPPPMSSSPKPKVRRFCV